MGRAPAEYGDWPPAAESVIKFEVCVVFCSCGLSLPREEIAVAVPWYLLYGLSYRDVEELLAERGSVVDHATIYRWVQTITSEFIDATRPASHNGDRSFVDETYVRVGGRWTYPYRVTISRAKLSVPWSPHAATARPARAFFVRALTRGTAPVEVPSDRAPVYPGVLDDLVPCAMQTACSATKSATWQVIAGPARTLMESRPDDSYVSRGSRTSFYLATRNFLSVEQSGLPTALSTAENTGLPVVICGRNGVVQPQFMDRLTGRLMDRPAPCSQRAGAGSRGRGLPHALPARRLDRTTGDPGPSRTGPAASKAGSPAHL